MPFRSPFVPRERVAGGAKGDRNGCSATGELRPDLIPEAAEVLGLRRRPEERLRVLVLRMEDDLVSGPALDDVALVEHHLSLIHI